MNKRISYSILAALFLTAACVSMQHGMIRASEIEDAVGFVVERHDGYVDASATMTPAEKEHAFRQSAHLLGTVLTADKYLKADTIKAALLDVCVRHDTYVTNDDSLKDVQRSVYLMNSRELVKLIKEATK